MTHTITLPWPDRVLHPNGRAHWSAIAKAKRFAKMEAFVETKKLGLRAPDDDSPIHVALTFYPKTRNRVDADNCVASMKANLDGIAAALDCDDSRFRLGPIVVGEPVKGGRVEVVLS